MKKISQKFIDQLLKYLSLGLLYVVAIVIVAVSLSFSFSKIGGHFGSVYTSDVYLSPYVKDNQTDFDQATERRDDNWKKLSPKECDQKLKELIDCYARRLVFLGYQEPRATWGMQDLSKIDQDDTFLSSSWLLNEKSALHISFNVDRPANLQVSEDAKAEVKKQFIQEYINNQMNLANQLSLETTDGVIVFSNQDINHNSISSTEPSSRFVKFSPAVNFNLKSNISKPKTVVELTELLDNPGMNFSSELTHSSFSSGEWSGISASAQYLSYLISSSRSDVQNGDRILVLWNTKYAAVNYARKIYYLYKRYENDKPHLDAYLNGLEQKFGKFLVKGKDDTDSIAISDKTHWDGFHSPQEITSNLIGYFCFKSASAVDAKTVDLTEYAPLFANYIVSYFRAQTGKRGDYTGIQWTNTSDFTSFLKASKSKDKKSNKTVTIKVEQSYFTPETVDLDNPKASLAGLSAANAKKLAGAWRTALPDNLFILRTEFEKYSNTPIPAKTGFKNKFEQSKQQPHTSLVSTTSSSQHNQNVKLSSASLRQGSDPSTRSKEVSSLPLWTVLVGLGIAFGLLGVFMVVTYRVAGLMSWVGTILTLTVTYILFFKFTGILTLASIFGLLLVGLLSLFSWIHTFELFRKRLKDLTPVAEAFAKATKQAFLPVFDMHLLVGSFTVPLLFLGKYVGQGFSIVAILGIFFSLVIGYAFSLITIKIFLSNHNWKKSKYLIFGRYKISSLSAEVSEETNSTVEFSQHKIGTWWSKRLVLTICSGIGLLAVLIVGVCFNIVYPINENFAVSIVVKDVLISWAISFFISLFYFWWRYHWTGMLAFVISSLITVLILYGGAQILLLPNMHFALNDLMLLVVVYLLAMLSFISTIDLQHRHFRGVKFTSMDEFRNQANWSLSGGFLTKWLSLSVCLLAFDLFLIPNAVVKYTYQNELLNEILLFNCVVILVGIINFCLTPYLYLYLVKLRNQHLSKSTRDVSTPKKHRWSQVNYDTCDEQTIVGINARK